jgi:GNAT superfamily N-acetyltransferase
MTTRTWCAVRHAQPDDAAQVATLLAELGYQGIGRQLVQAAENAASELGCVVMEVTTARSRTESHPFYQNLGYQDWNDRSVRYVKDLVPGASMVSYGSRFRAASQAPGS